MPDGPVKAGVTRALNAMSNFETETAGSIAKIRANADLTPDGKRKAVRAEVAKNAHEVLRIQKLADRAKSRFVEKRTKVQFPAVDRTDAITAAVYRAFWDKAAKMSPGELKALLPTASLTFCQAILAAPIELIGAVGNAREDVLSRAIEIAQPGATAAFDRDMTALNVAAQALGDVVKGIADLPNNAALNEFLNTSVPDQRNIDADIERSTEPLAAA
jgi:hypothetical protein